MWSPISPESLRELIRESEAELSPDERLLWELIQISPRKWAQSPWGDEGGGFWAVGVIGGDIIWYNDIEEGFNISRYFEPGTIGEYRCNQGGLQPVLWNLLHKFEGDEGHGVFGPPQLLADPG